MKKLLMTTAIFSLLFVSTANACEETCIVADPRDPTLNMRTTPNGAVFTTVRNGIEVMVLERSGKWTRITAYEDSDSVKTGWVFSARLKCN